VCKHNFGTYTLKYKKLVGGIFRTMHGVSVNISVAAIQVFVFTRTAAFFVPVVVVVVVVVVVAPLYNFLCLMYKE